MHELSYVTELYKRLLKEQKQIADVYITVSSSSGIEHDSFLFYWRQISQDVSLTKATLHITKLPQTLRCTQCLTKFSTEEDDILLLPCPSCQSHKTILMDQPSVTIEKIIYETDENY